MAQRYAWSIIPLALVIGSWLGVFVRRYPSQSWLTFDRSHCEFCKQTLSPRDLIPIFSFLVLRGRCRSCGVQIHWSHLMIEVTALVIGILAYVISFDGIMAWINAYLGWALLAAAAIDLRTLRLPDTITLQLTLTGLLVTWFYHPETTTIHAVAAITGFCAFRGLNSVHRALRGQDGLGAGDAKLLAAAGAWLGLWVLPDLVLIAAIGGLLSALLAKVLLEGPILGRAIAFGPYLAAAFFALQLIATSSPD